MKALYETLLRAPNGDPAWLVAADELSGQGDVRGPVMALQCKGALSTEERKLEARLLKKHAGDLCGALRPVVELRSIEVQRGFVTGLRLKAVRFEALSPLLADPLWRFMKWVDVEALEERTMRELIEALPWVTGLGGLPLGVVERMAPQRARALERLGVVATAKHQLHLEPGLLRALTNERFPALRALRTGRRFHVHAVVPLLAQLPKLEALSVANLRADNLVDGELAFLDWVPALTDTPLERFELREDDGAGFWSTRMGWVVQLERDSLRRFNRLAARFHSFPSRVTPPYQRLAQGLRRWFPALSEVRVEGLTLSRDNRVELEAMFTSVPAAHRHLG